MPGHGGDHMQGLNQASIPKAGMETENRVVEIERGSKDSKGKKEF